MPTFARLAQEKTLSLCMYSELEIEEMAGLIYGSGVAGEFLAGIEWIHLPAAVERSKFQQIDL